MSHVKPTDEVKRALNLLNQHETSKTPTIEGKESFAELVLCHVDTLLCYSNAILEVALKLRELNDLIEYLTTS